MHYIRSSLVLCKNDSLQIVYLTVIRLLFHLASQRHDLRLMADGNINHV